MFHAPSIPRGSIIRKVLVGDGIIDEETYKRKKENLVQQKIALKGEQDTLLRKQMSGWNEPMRDYINTLIYAGKIASEQSPQDIAHFAQKIGTNRLISEKIVSWDFVPPFDFTVQFLASRARRRGEQTSPFTSKNLTNPVWCARKDSNPQPSDPKSDTLSIELRAQSYLPYFLASIFCHTFSLKRSLLPLLTLTRIHP